jgi:hypothetical protein
MSAIGALVGATLPAVAIWLTMIACDLGRVIRSRTVLIALAVCSGLGLSALSSFWLVANGTGMGLGFVLTDATLWLVVGGVAWRARRRRLEGPRHKTVSVPTSDAVLALTTADWLVRGLFALIAMMAIGTIVMGYWALPHGEWDAWAIWNQKARFLARDGRQWVSVLAIDWSQPGHPLLVPLTVARLWAYAGREITLVPGMVGIVFGAATVAVVMGALNLQKKRAWCAGAVLLAPSMFLQQWTAQQADIPFAFFMVASVAVLTRISSSAPARNTQGLLLMAGSLASLAAWTKNEGSLLLGVTTLVALVIVVRSGHVRSVIWWGIGVIPALLTVVWFKFTFAPVAPYYLPEGPWLEAVAARLFDHEFRTVIDSALWERWAGWGGPAAAGAAPLITVAAAWAALSRGGHAARELIAAPMAMLAGYYMVYVLTEVDVMWLIATTFDRLLAQLWPSLVLAAFFVADAHDHRPTSTRGGDLPPSPASSPGGQESI